MVSGCVVLGADFFFFFFGFVLIGLGVVWSGLICVASLVCM